MVAESLTNSGYTNIFLQSAHSNLLDWLLVYTKISLLSYISWLPLLNKLANGQLRYERESKQANMTCKCAHPLLISLLR